MTAALSPDIWSGEAHLVLGVRQLGYHDLSEDCWFCRLSQSASVKDDPAEGW